jgi:7-keto-8-aminopelargonate synthetase-like enzyme
MENLSQQVELVNRIVSHGRDIGIGQVKVQNHSTNGRTIKVDGKEIVYFGNCSYLGLELDNRIKEAAIDAIQRYGTQFACSRTYASLTIYDELEYLLGEIFERPTLVAPTTTLGHMSNITTLVNSDDAIILDHQVHASVNYAVQIVKASGTYVEVLRHNNMDVLENRIIKLKEKYKRIWYMSDGIYSMYGDSAPLKEMHEMMNRHEQLWCYVDDAHGMSWEGKNGSGFALKQLPYFHERLLLTVSLVKGFGVHGGALIYPNKETKDIVRNCGGTLMFASPMPPVTIASNIASAKIHLTDEIYDLQNSLKDKMSYFLMTAKGLNLPVISEELTPIFFIGLGSPESGYEMALKMKASGFLLNMAVFPAVPYKNTGMRSIVTNHHTKEDIYEMLNTLSEHMTHMEKSNTINKESIHKAFGLRATV